VLAISICGTRAAESSKPGTGLPIPTLEPELLSGVLLATTGLEADAVAHENLFAPLGISDWDWQEQRWQGHPDMSHELKLRPRDMAKLGQMVLDNGAWQGRQVISSDWIAQSTQTHIQETPHDVSYAYLWWRLDPPPPQMTLGPVTFANGVGSQYISVFPEARLVIVATGGNYFNSRQFDIVDLIQRHMLQGVTPAK